MILINLALPLKLIDGVIGTGSGDVFALPVKACVLSWQTSFDVAPDAVSITLEVSIDGTHFVIIDTSTAVAGEVRVVAGLVAALFIRATVGTNTGNKQVTVTLLAKADL